MMKLVEASVQSYKRVYMEGVPIGTNRGMALGKEIHTALEEGTQTGNIVHDLTLAQLPKYEINDKQFLIDVQVGKIKVPIRIQPDTMREDWSAFRDRKTGAGPWTQKIVDEDSQFVFYATGIHALKGIVPEIYVDWMPTKKVVGPDGIERPELTGEVITFKRRPITTKDILLMKVRMARAWELIGKIMEDELI